MSVIVNGMKMPECCAVCKFLTYDDWANGNEYECTALSEFMDDDKLPEGRRKDCPLTELIRCKYCKYSKPIDSEWLECQHDKRVMKHEGFCSWAEPKETE